MNTWYMVVNVEKCENCRNCFLACKDEHVGNNWPGYALPMPDQGPSWISTEGRERGHYPFIDVAYLTKPCMHCEDAPCVEAAKDGAVYKRPDGIVLIDPVKAQGQKGLSNVCPYGAISWNNVLQLPQKCTLCAHLLDKGWAQTRCVQSCPTGALDLLHVESTEMERIAANEGLQTFHPELGTRPRVFYRNLYRFTKCFIGGSAVIRINDREECAEGVTATLLDSKGKEASQCMTDNYGDFKFDSLETKDGQYTIRFSLGGYETMTVVVDLKESTYIGVIALSSL
jgi:Fe-S-cluster-containing dehydrogenase component